MTWHAFMHGLGIGCLLCIGAIALGSIAASLIPNWPRIWDTLNGRPWPARHPIASPTASVLPLRTRHSRLPVVEADAQPTRKAS
jgi:hypothetical protein